MKYFWHVNGCRPGLSRAKIKRRFCSELVKRQDPLYQLNRLKNPLSPPSFQCDIVLLLLISNIDTKHCYLRYLMCIHVCRWHRYSLLSVYLDVLRLPCRKPSAAMVFTDRDLIEYTRFDWHLSTHFEHCLIQVISLFNPISPTITLGTLMTSAAADVINHNRRKIGLF